MPVTIQTVDDIRQHIPTRFSRGAGLCGPEFFACSNTGMRPIIRRSPYKEVKDTVFMVGPEVAVDEHKRQIALDRLTGRNKRKYGNDPRRTVYVFTTRSSAVEKFLALCQKVLDYNRQEADTVRDLRQKANKGDMQAALELGDHV